MLTALQYSSYRAIVTKIEIEYLKKAKGELTAVSELDFLFSEMSEEKVEKVSGESYLPILLVV